MKIEKSKPNPDVEWLDINGRPITTKSDRFKTTTVGRLTTLEVLGLDNDVRGNYLLIVRNELGEAKCEIPIEVLQYPNTPNRPILEKQKFNSVSLKWNAVPEAASKNVQYIVEMKKEGEKEWVKMMESAQLNATVKELEPGNTYRFRVRASIADIISEPSEESELFLVKYEKLEKKEKEKAEEEKEEINYGELVTGVKQSEYRDIDVQQLPSDFESKYIFCEKIGVGACGTVYRAIERATGKNWAAKMITISADVTKEVIMHEVMMMNELHHEKLLNLHEAFDSGNKMCLIEELISGGDLHDKIIDDKALMSEDEARTFIRQILQGVQHMHNKNIAHLDLKPENIMFTSNASNKIKIIDFGLAQKLEPNKKIKLLFCTAEFCPPEVINVEPVGLSADMWTIGVIAYLLLSGDSPFIGRTNQETRANVSSGDWQFRDVVWDKVSDLAKDFIAKLIVKNKDERMTVSEALAHPWIAAGELKEKRGKIPVTEKKAFLIRKDMSDVLIPMGKIVKTGAIFRKQSTDGTFERDITFEGNFPPRVLKSLEDIVVSVGEANASLICEIEALPQPTIQWLKDGKEICLEASKYEAQCDGNIVALNVKNVVKADSGVYSMIATNSLGFIRSEAKVSIEEAKVEKKKKAKKIAAKETGAVSEIPNDLKENLENDQKPKMPKFIEKMQNAKGNEGDMLTLKCKVSSEWKPEIRWLLNGKSIEEDDRILMRTFDDGICELEIIHLTAELCGTYTAIAHNTYGDAQTNAKVALDAVGVKTAREPFFVMEPIKDLVIGESNALNIVCDIDGEPQPKVTWFKDNSLIKDDRFAIQKDDINHRITISSVSPGDEGVYRVEAENSSGKIFADITVHVTPKPKSEAVKEKADQLQLSVSIGQPYATQLTKDSLLLKWAAPEDGHSKMEFVVEQRRSNDQTWTHVGKSLKTELSITGLQAGTEYVFRVAAKNKAGQTIYSPLSTAIITLPLGKKPALKNIPPATLLLNEKKNIELIVEFEADSKSSVKWYKNGIELIDGKNSVTITTLAGKSSKLIIKKPKGNVHPGLYSCHIENEIGETVCETRIIEEKDKITAEEVHDETRKEPVEGQPQIMVPLSNETIAVGQQFILSCEIKSSPKGVVSWFRNDERLAPIGRYEMLEQENIYKLICHNAQGNDSAAYRCVVTNPIGIAQSTCQITVTESIPRMAPKFEVPLEDKTALAGKEVKLKCRILGDPQPQITWTKDGTTISTTRHQKLQFTEDGWCSLTIFNCTAEDTGFYLCTASNVLGSESSQLMLTVAEVAGPDSHLVTAENIKMQYSKPRFTRVPGAVVETTEGSTVKLISRAVGLPKPLVKWFKDGKEITKVNRAYEILLTGEGESVLFVECAVTKTAGTFKCVAENSEGSTSFETKLIIHSLAHKQHQEEQAPNFTMDLTDIGVAIGHPVTLKCCVKGIPEPQLKWIFINDTQQTSVLRTTTDSAWSEYREGDSCEMKTESVVKTQQGTYQCIASNEHGRAMTQCYLLIGDPHFVFLSIVVIRQTVSVSEPLNQPAGPPRFLKCLRDIWSSLSGDIEFEVEVSGYPLPELTWYHLDEKILEDNNIKISYITPTKCQLKITSLSVSHLGTYSVEASNIHGIVRTTASLNVGKKRSEVEPPKLPEDFKEDLTTDLPQEQPSERSGISMPGIKAGSQHRGIARSDLKRRGAAPAFLIGLEDLEFREGDAAALAGTVAKKRRHRIHGRSDGKRMKQIVTLGEAQAEASASSSSSVEPQIDITTLEEIRAIIAERNKNICRPKFMVKPKPKKSIVEHKSLRLKTAISANPVPVVRWDKAGVVLETGNKYSIYNDGDFYYLEVHHVSKIDEGFYNCSASNSEGFVTCTAEIEVIPGDGTRRLRKALAAPSFIEVLPGKFKATNGEPVLVECSVSGYPAPAIQWLRNGDILVPEHDRYLILYDGETTTLKFLSIAASDAGKYVCIAKNQEGEAKTAMQLDVEPKKISPTGGMPPKFRTDGRREAIKALDGDKVVLLAELVQGSEPLTIRWIRNKMEIQDSTGFGYSREEANCYLTISDAFPEDAGVYTCEATNEFGVAKCNVLLVVAEHQNKSGYENPPVILNAPTNASVEQGNDLTLSVTVRGYPEPAVVWTKNMVSIASGEKYQMANSGEVFTLTICNCTNEDHGKYELQAVNLSGTAKAIIAVNVTEATDLDAVMPRFIKLPISIQSTIGQKANLTCTFKGLLPTVTWFHGDKKLVSGRNGIEITSTATTSTLSILQLTNEHFGEYLCAVRNNYGEDLAKAVIFLEGSSVALPLLNGK
uniref:Myosin light chain kinase, smooth muscle n=1 Tax=Elaeophora elaphi TaxID=1147741 RepID=A0A158Q7F2_9BILA